MCGGFGASTLCFLSCWISCSSWRHSASALATSLSPASLVAAMLARACEQKQLFGLFIQSASLSEDQQPEGETKEQSRMGGDLEELDTQSPKVPAQGNLKTAPFPCAEHCR